jgi:hypothetical protein
MYSHWTPRHEHNYRTVNAAVTNDDVSNHRIQFKLCDEEVIYGRYKTLSEKAKTFIKQSNDPVSKRQVAFVA